MYNVPSDTDQLRLAVKTLLQTPVRSSMGMCFCGTDGEDAFPEAVLRTPRVVLPNREYYLCKVSLAGFVSGIVENAWQAENESPHAPSVLYMALGPDLVHHQDVDPHWAGIGGDQDRMEQLLAEHSLDVVPLETNEILSFYS